MSRIPMIAIAALVVGLTLSAVLVLVSNGADDLPPPSLVAEAGVGEAFADGGQADLPERTLPAGIEVADDLSVDPTADVDGADEPNEALDLAYGAYQRFFYQYAFQLALPLAEDGNAASQTLIGILFSEGFGVPQDLGEAAAWFEIAADAGDANAQLQLGLAYLDGAGVDVDRARAADYFELAAAQGLGDAMYNIGLLHLEQDGVREQDYVVAAGYLSQAADQRIPEAQYVLAQLYTVGEGVILSQQIANRWLRSAAEGGLVVAQIDYGIRLFQGVGGGANEDEAAKWFRRAALAGNPVGQVRYGQALALGAGAVQDSIEAAKYYLLARAAGLDDPWLADFFSTLTEQEQQAAFEATTADI